MQAALEALGSSLEAVTEGTLALSEHDLPEPDILVGRFTPTRDYVRTEQVVLVVEIADTSLRTDLGPKRDLYAAAGIPEYWVVDVNTADVHRFADASDGSYRTEPPILLAGELRSLTIPGLVIEGTGIL